jgi:hypothetical protein
VTALDKHPLYVAVFLAALVAPQARGFVTQLTAGFVPFSHAPQRVAFSWDMFSVPITRCTIDWDPKVKVGGALVGRLHDRGQPLEWDPVYDRAEDYALAAKAECAYAKGTNTIIVCFHQDGRTTQDELHCR